MNRIRGCLDEALLRATNDKLEDGTVLRYVLEEADASPELVETFVVEELGDEAREVYMTAAQRIREQGKAEGRAEGKAEGKAEGRAEAMPRARRSLWLGCCSCALASSRRACRIGSPARP